LRSLVGALAGPQTQIDRSVMPITAAGQQAVKDGVMGLVRWRVKMSKFLLTLCAFGLFLSSAFAQEKSLEQLDRESARLWGTEGVRKDQVQRIVPSGTSQRVSFFTWINPDCSSAGNINVRVVNQPEHGKVEVASTSDYPHYSKEQLRFKCNHHRVKGVAVSYKADKYVGDDAFDVLVIYPEGFAREVRYDISVR
jgi:hypothetical protein